MIVFETGRLQVRQFTRKDFKQVYLQNSNAAVMRYIRPVQNRRAAAQFLTDNISFYRKHPGMGRWALIHKQSGAFIGTVAIIFVEGSLEVQVGYALMEPWWGKGYATEITKAAVAFAFERLSVSFLLGITYPENIASQQVLLKAGFKKTDNRVEDGKTMYVFSIDKEA